MDHFFFPYQLISQRRSELGHFKTFTQGKWEPDVPFRWKIRLVNVEEVGSCASLRDNLRSCFYPLDDGEPVLRLSHYFPLFFVCVLF